MLNRIMTCTNLFSVFGDDQILINWKIDFVSMTKPTEDDLLKSRVKFQPVTKQTSFRFFAGKKTKALRVSD